MILPMRECMGDCCIFCGKYVSPRQKGGEYLVIKDGRKKIATRRFHRECYLDNAQESKRIKYEKV